MMPDRLPAHRVRVWLLAFWMAVLLSASLFPFDFSAELWRERAAGLQLDRSLFGHSTRADLIGNLLAYLPVGLLVTLLLGRRAAWLRLAIGTLAGVVLSFAVESFQLGIVMRFASATDFFANSLSAAVGAGAALLYGSTPRQAGVSARLRDQLPGAAVPFLLAFWVASQAAPFVPRLRLARISTELADFCQWGMQDGSLPRSIAALLILAALLRALFRKEWFWPSFTLAVIGSWFAGIVFVQHQLTAGVCLAGLLACPAVAWLHRQNLPDANGRAFWTVIGLLLAAALIAAAPTTSPKLLPPLFLVFGALWLGANSRIGLFPAAAVLVFLVLLRQGVQVLAWSQGFDPTDLLLLVFGVLFNSLLAVDEVGAAR